MYTNKAKSNTSNKRTKAPKKQLTISVSEDEERMIKLAAVLKDKTLSETVMTFVREGLKKIPVVQQLMESTRK